MRGAERSSGTEGRARALSHLSRAGAQRWFRLRSCHWGGCAVLLDRCRQPASHRQTAIVKRAVQEVEELNEQVSELSDLASQYLNTAQRTYDRTEQRRLEDLAHLAQDEADRLYNQLLAIKP